MKRYYEEHPNNEPLKGYDTIDIEKLEFTPPEDIVYSSDETPLLGTFNGIAVIIKGDSGETALGHFLSDFDFSTYSMLNGVDTSGHLKILVIPGTSILSERVNNYLTFLHNKNNLTLYNFEVNLINLANYDENGFGIDFAYDTRTGQFLKPNYSEILSRGVNKWMK